MATHKAPPWRCRLCMKTLKGHMPRCGWCGEAWQNCYDPAFVPGDRAPSTPRKYQEQPAATPWTAQQQTDSYTQWGQEQGPVRYQSPRPKTRRRPGRGRGRAQQGAYTQHVPPPVPPPVPQKGAGKGVHASAPAHSQLLAPPPPPPAFLTPSHQAPASQIAPTAVATDTAAPDNTGFAPAVAAPSEAEIRLKSLMRELRKAPEEKLTPAIQEEMKKNTQREQDMDAKGLHRAVNDVKKARRAVSSAVSARAKLMTDWKTFLQQSVVTWKEYTLMFQTQEKTLQDNLVAAQEGLAQAKKSFEELSEALRESGVQGHLRRRQGECQCRGGDGVRDDQAYPRGSLYSRQQPTGADGQGRARRATSQEAEKGSRGARRRCWGLHLLVLTSFDAAFWQGRQQVTREYSCLGPCPTSAETALMQWQHSILEEATFRAPWTALQNAIHVAHEVGTSSALKVETVCVRKAHSCKPTVCFAEDVHLVIEHEGLNRTFCDVFPLEHFSSWHAVPWTLRPLHLLHEELPVAHADPLSLAVSISGNRHQNAGSDPDELSMMQYSAATQQFRAELPGPPWIAPNHQAIAPQPVRHPINQVPDVLGGDDEVHEFEVQPRSPTSSSSTHVSQKVCLFHLDDPPVFGHIDWTDYHMMMFEAARLLQVPVDQLLSLIDIATPLQDLPTDVVPLIAQLVGDIDPGEPGTLPLQIWRFMQTNMKDTISRPLRLIVLCMHFHKLQIAEVSS